MALTVRPVRGRPAGQHADARVLSGLGERVARLEPLRLAAEVRGHLRAEVVGQRQEDLRAQALQERAPRLARERRPQRADALRRDDRNAARLARQREELLVAGRLVLARRRERLVLVADEQHRRATAA